MRQSDGSPNNPKGRVGAATVRTIVSRETRVAHIFEEATSSSARRAARRRPRCCGHSSIIGSTGCRGTSLRYRRTPAVFLLRRRSSSSRVPMIDDWFRSVELPIAFSEFVRLPRHPAYKYEYFDGRALLTPRPHTRFAIVELDAL